MDILLLRLIFSIALLTISNARNEKQKSSESSEEVETYSVLKQTTRRPVHAEAVVEKFVETLMSSERYLKLVETVEKKLNHLDNSFHEKTSTIIKYLTEILRLLEPLPEVEGALKTVQNELNSMSETLHSRGFMAHNHVKPLGQSQNDALWKEYEQELNDAMLYGKKRENITRLASSRTVDTDTVIEKIMDTITSSEKYLKKVDSIDYKLNRLDIEVHDKTNDILKYLGEIMKAVRGQGSTFKTGSMMEHLVTEVASVKKLLTAQGPVPGQPRAGVLSVGRSGMEPSLEERLAQLEGTVRTAAAGVDSIIATISEVKNRPYIARDSKSDPLMDTSSLITEFRRTLFEQKAKKCDCKQGSGRVDRSERYPLDCYEIQTQGFNVSGIFKIHPDGMEPFYVLCDLTTAGGGWTVFQNRFDGSQDFYKGWTDYKYGFGNLAGEFWLGLDKLHYLTNQKLYELRVELETQNGHEAYAAYSVLVIGSEYEGYRISTLGTYYGTAGDSLTYHAGQKFSAMDMDHDEWKDGSCAVEHGGAWWYKECDKSNLNGFYVSSDEHRSHTIYWISFKGPSLALTRTKMMIRPLPARRPLDYAEQSRHVPESRSEAKAAHGKGLKNKPRRPDGYRLPQPAGDAFYTAYA